MAELLLGIDVGTTRAKVGIFSLDGRLEAIAIAPYAMDKTSKDGLEQEPREWWAQIRGAVQKTLLQIDVSGLRGVCVGGQGPTLVALDETLEPVAPALTWLDRRAGSQVQTLSERAKRFVPLHSFLAKAMWLSDTHPEAYAKTRWFVQAWDYIASQLTGSASVSTSAGVNPWNAELLDASGLDKNKFPMMQRMGERVGVVSVKAARETGLPQGLPVIGGITDYFLSILGSGAVCRGMACDSGGTSTSFNVCWDEPHAVKGIFCMPSFEPGYWYIGGPASTTGRALDWWRRDILHADDWTLVEQAGAIPPGSAGLVFLPYLAGERAPLWDANARGVFFGLGLTHTQAHMTRAIMESVAFSMQHVMEHMQAAGATVDEIHCCGGQATSGAWNQIKADVLGRRVIVPEVIEASVMGAAIIAGVGVGAFENFTQGAQRMVHSANTIEPNTENHARYCEMYAVYRDLYQAVQPLYERLNEAM